MHCIPNMLCTSSNIPFSLLTAAFLPPLSLPAVTVGVGELTAGKRHQPSNRLNFPFVCRACDSLYFKSELGWVRLGNGSFGSVPPPPHPPPCAICELSFSTWRHTLTSVTQLQVWFLVKLFIARRWSHLPNTIWRIRCNSDHWQKDYQDGCLDWAAVCENHQSAWSHPQTEL